MAKSSSLLLLDPFNPSTSELVLALLSLKSLEFKLLLRDPLESDEDDLDAVDLVGDTRRGLLKTLLESSRSFLLRQSSSLLELWLLFGESFAKNVQALSDTSRAQALGYSFATE